jgi:hypothetical protein
MLFHCGLPSYGLDASLRDPRVSDASFAITFTAARPGDVDRIRSLLEGTGAIEVTVGTDTFYEVPNVV